ncbi:DUF2058 domain-containing protein [Marinomonas ostreistagni]|uniref:DUF2058 domain-containing protein n=1 Tax=Marinomonas ostreistagni TaxID=359209 RepID=A0ABS0ZCN7_9GAMM|nr:DUF2058 domain-containing protein [Marinomonas ostreistagni]MBJ7551405.1 DUF2058 domain-containing protein [Marinomonas ostreistagni]
MAKSLQEQLLGAGIVDKKKAKKIKAEKLQTKQKMKKGQLDNSAEEARQAELKRQKEEKAARDKELNLKRQAEIEYKAILGQIRQIIIQNRVVKEDGEIAYNFTDDKKVKKLYVSEKMHKDLSEGRLAIAKLEGQYEIIPKGIAEKVQEKEPDMILVLNTSSKVEEVDEDDPYAEFQIPDDLMW